VEYAKPAHHAFHDAFWIWQSEQWFWWMCVVIALQYEDIVQLEWLSNFVEDSFCGGNLTMKKVDEPSCTTKEDSVHNQFHTSSPVSVLESSSSCSGGKTVAAPPRSPEVYIPVPCGRARSKRPRPATFNPRPAMNLISPASSFVGENMQPNVISSKASSDSENFAESQLVAKMPKQASGEAKKKKKVKVTVPAAPADSNQNGLQQPVRKCMHCEITKTPQWRAGPMGPKTLCNACGVRFKSGRLYPEYRPAASPTFCPSLHSNSHKKVLEMRCRGIDKSGYAMNAAASPELIPNTNSSLTLEYMWLEGGMILCWESLFRVLSLMLFLIDISFLWFIGFCTGLDSGNRSNRLWWWWSYF